MKAFLVFFTIILFFCAFYSVKGQFSENFADGNFTNAPVWHGDSSFFEIKDGVLHLNARPDAGEAMMTTRSSTGAGAHWTFELYMDFNPSSRNYADVYIVSDSKNLHSPLNGYFVRIGYADDNVCLYKQCGNRNSVKKIIEGAANRMDGTSVRIRIRVTCNETGYWTLFSDPELTGTLVTEGTATDQTFKGSRYFGLLCKYTSTRADKFYFDNITVTGPVPADTIPPFADSVRQVASNSLKIYFSEPVTAFPAGMADNYRIDRNGNLWSRATSVQIFEKTALVNFENEFEKDVPYQLNIERLADNCLNSTHLQSCSFKGGNFSAVDYRDVVINEIMADPYPVAGLTNDEYVELFNPSEKTVNLAGWKLTGAGNGLLPDCLLPPGGFVILTAPTAVSDFSGPALSWGNSGNLLNEGEWLFLRNPSGLTIDSLKYDISWYKDSSHKNGGWSLEQVNPYISCSGPDNWNVSKDATGGTPGSKNSVFAEIPDSTPPELTGIHAVDSINVLLSFSEMPFTYQALSFHLTGGPTVDTVTAGPEYNQLMVRFLSPFKEGRDYSLELKDIADCAGNQMEPVTGIFRFDKTPPAVQSVISVTEYKIRIQFSEKIDSKSACRVSNYRILPDQVQPQHVTMAGKNGVYLTFSEPLKKNVYTISCNGIDDLNGNTLKNGIFSFEFYLAPQPEFNDLVISEIMADPIPVQGLPPCEYLELHNVSGHEIRMGDAVLQVGGNVRTIEELYLDKEGYALLCARSSKNDFGPGITVITLSNWPAIKNHGDTLTIYRKDGKLIFAVAYDDSWYQSLEKKSGGWSLEMIDVTRGCAGKDNWKASADPSGGTPGRANSVPWSKPDLKGPELLSAGAPDPFTVILKFSERLHPEKTDDMIIETAPESNISGKKLIMPLGDKVRVTFNDELDPGITYHIRIDNAVDCCGNINGKANRTATFILPSFPTEGDILINEILFHPRTGGVEFVELYNRTNRSFNLQKLSIAVEKDGDYLRKKALCSEMHIYEPESFLVLTKDPSLLKGDYPGGNAETFFKMPLPRLNNEEGTIVLLRDDGEIIDKVFYSEHFHHPMIANPAGVSLERTSLTLQTGNEKLWHSAASAAGYATPGKMNSQYLPEGMAEEYISVEPQVIAPNVPGIPDFSTIRFSFAEYGMMGTIEVYDIEGRKIKTIAKNELLAIGGSYVWRGDDDTGRGVRTGRYILRFEIFNPDGRQQIIKKTITVGRNF